MALPDVGTLEGDQPVVLFSTREEDKAAVRRASGGCLIHRRVQECKIT